MSELTPSNMPESLIHVDQFYCLENTDPEGPILIYQHSFLVSATIPKLRCYKTCRRLSESDPERSRTIFSKRSKVFLF